MNDLRRKERTVNNELQVPVEKEIGIYMSDYDISPAPICPVTNPRIV
jgi:hypothetical protein